MKSPTAIARCRSFLRVTVLLACCAGGITPSFQAVAQVGCATPPTGLVAWWPGEGNADDVVGGLNGTMVNGSGFAPGEVNEAFSFNGVSDYTTNSSPGISNVLNTYTVEFWAWPTVGRATTPEAISGIDGISGQRYAIFPNNGGFGDVGSGVSVGTNGISVFEHGAVYLASPLVHDAPIVGWTHVAVVYVNRQPQLYVNGVLARTGLVSDRNSYPCTTMGEIGVGYGYYAGLLDEVSIYNRELAPAEIEGLYNIGAGGKCPVPPTILAQPASQPAYIGDTFTLGVRAAGSPTLTYQWKFNGTPINNATASSLTLANVQIADSGNYSVQVTNNQGSTDSSAAVVTVSLRPPCAVPPAGLVGWWRGESNFVDEIGGNNGTGQGSITFVPGEVGAGFTCNTLNSGVSVGNPAALQLQDFTIESWIRRGDANKGSWDTYDGAGIFLCTWGGYGLGLMDDGRILLGKVGFDAVFSTNRITDTNTFHHVAATKTGSVVKLFIDGMAETTAAYNSAFVFNGPSAIGARGSDLASTFLGAIDEVSIYNRALSVPEVQSIYAAGGGGKCPVPPTITTQPAPASVFVGDTATFSVAAVGSPVLSYQWKFNGANITAATNSTLTLANVQLAQAGNYLVQVTNAAGTADSSNALLTVIGPGSCATPPPNMVSWWRAETNALDQISGNHGALNGNAAYGAGRVGQSFVLDGNGDVVTVGNPANLRLQDFSIEAWIKRGSTNIASVSSGGGEIFGYGSGGYCLGMSDSGALYLTKVDVDNVTTTHTITDTNWHHVAVTKVGSAVVFYFDAVSYPAPVYNTSYGFTSPAAIGGRGDTLANSFLGSIDEVAVYSRALAAAEIQGIYFANVSGKCVVPAAPFVTSQPANQTVTAGGTATFNVAAGGSPVLSYQWRLNGTNLAGATGSALTLSGVQISQAGNYSVVITNTAGSATSSNALLTVNFPPAVVRIPNTNVVAGSTVTLPILLVANGNENALGFSLTFDTNRLSFLGAAAGSGAPGAGLSVNTSQANAGRLGLGVNLPPGATFAPGTQVVAQVSFFIPPTAFPGTFAFNFGDLPVARQLLDPQLTILPANFSSALITITIAPAFEADVYPRPNGDRASSLADWLMLGRYVARLDYPTNASEFQRADCAPRATLGDGVIRAADWVQAGRYVFGLDPQTAIGGPSAEVSGVIAGPSATRILSTGGALLAQGAEATIPISLAAQGNENALSFSLSFDPALVAFTGATTGTGAGGATLFVNSSQAASGRLGFALALGAGGVLPAGTRELVRVSFQPVPFVTGNFVPSFTDLPVPREVSDYTALAQPASYAASPVEVRYQPALRIAPAGTNVMIAWPLWATNYVLQGSVGALSSVMTWTNLSVGVVISNNESTVIVPPAAAARFYRLHHP